MVYYVHLCFECWKERIGLSFKLTNQVDFEAGREEKVQDSDWVQKEPLSLKTMSNIILQYGYDKKNLINLRFAAMCVLGFLWIFEVFRDC